MNAVVKPRFDTTIQYGHILQAVAMVAGIFGATVFVSMWFSNLEQRVIAQERLAVRYVPIIDALDAANKVQDFRIDTVSESIQDIRKIMTELLSNMGSVRESLAEMKVRAYYQDRATTSLSVPIPPPASNQR